MSHLTSITFIFDNLAKWSLTVKKRDTNRSGRNRWKPNTAPTLAINLKINTEWKIKDREKNGSENIDKGKLFFMDSFCSYQVKNWLARETKLNIQQMGDRVGTTMVEEAQKSFLGAATKRSLEMQAGTAAALERNWSTF